MRELLGEAHRLGIRVCIATIVDDPTLQGYYLTDHAMIVLRHGLTRAETRSVLAHELGHAFYRHDCSTPVNERQADVYAARLLIDPVEYARLERVDPDRHHLADDLGVTASLLLTYEEHCLAKLRGVTYSLPRMGAAQFAHRAEVA